MSDSPLVSIIIPMYNSEDYIENTLKSVLKQTYVNIEIIVVDDGSADRGAQKVKRLQCKYDKIKYVYQHNKGVSVARNTGISNSTGEYVAFLDSDDLWLENKLEEQMEAIQSKGCEACYCGYTEYVGGHMKNKFPVRFYEGKILHDLLEGRTAAWTCTWLVKKDIITQNNISFTEGCKFGEDLEFFLKIACVARVCAVEEYLAIYRKRSGSAASFSLIFPENRITEIDMWLRLSSWMLVWCMQMRTSDKIKAVYIINTYRIPSTAIQFLFRGKVLGMDMTGSMEQYELSKHVRNFKPKIAFESFKLLIQREVVQNQLILRLVSGTCRKIFLSRLVNEVNEKAGGMT